MSRFPLLRWTRSGPAAPAAALVALSVVLFATAALARGGSAVPRIGATEQAIRRVEAAVNEYVLRCTVLPTTALPAQDGWGRDVRARLPGEHNPGFVDLWSPGANGADEAGAGDDINNWSPGEGAVDLPWRAAQILAAAGALLVLGALGWFLKGTVGSLPAAPESAENRS